MNKYLNDSNFKMLVFLPLIYVIFNFALSFVYFSMNYGNINQDTANSIDSLSFLVAFIFSIVMFRRDLSFLRANNAHCPSWGWYFIFPVYIYKRQKNNNLGMFYFWMYMISTFLLTKVLSKILTALLISYIRSKY